MTVHRVALALVLLVVMTAFTGCGGDDESSTTTVTETTTDTGTSASEAPAGPAVAELQQVMTRLGYYSGPIDGIYGAETHAALGDKAASIVTQVQTVLAEYGY